MAPPGSTTAKRVRNTTHPQVTAMLEEWVQQAIVAKVNITGEVICEKWKHFAQLCGIPSAEWLSLSHGWLDAFRQRNGLRHFKQAAQLSANAAKQPEPDLTRLLAITSQYAPEDIYNMDETGLFYALPPDKELAEGQGEEAQKLKARLTIVLATNADGSDRHPLLFIGKTEETITDPEAGIEYRQNVKGTMTPLIFQQWLTSWNVRLANSDRRPVLLLIDDSSTHKLPTGSPLSHIRIESTGTISQPIMLGVVQSFKAHYRRRSTGRAISRVEQLPASEIYAIDPITAMRLCRSAWNAVSIQTVLNAWTASGLVGHHTFRSLNEQVSRSGCEASEHIIHVSQPTPEASGSVQQISEPVIQVSESVLQVSQPDEQASESIPQASKPVPQHSQTGSEACEPVIQVSEPITQPFEPPAL
ncbi:hypothetical protein CROQUDRAFT_41298 [Cronartium quercuum f. sp. fusiforme G11]|uniref:HTH CENPB-type domain-containing protein n=1 Tax=Cronartium quercuum f. sp. fusiforme G11 TaxID=708437 RepID=A0A9P6TDK6_9BASI|nr:hypothetical protein CROQUDRAFT_41298 [Cronartium quercuum f. sp. fusiforme G11]